MTELNAHLFHALHDADVEAAARLLAQGANPNAPAPDHMSPLLEAAQGESPDILRLLLEYEAPVNTRGRSGNTPLHLATAAGRTANMRVLLEFGAEVNAPNFHEETPLYLAAENGDEECCRLLLEHGATLAAENWAELTPLHAAFYNQQAATLRLLLEHASRNAPSAWLHLAHTALYGSAEELAALIRSGVDINLTDSEGLTALDLAAATGADTACARLLEQGARMETRPLHHAASNGHLSCVQLLLAHGANPGEADADNESTPLHEAASSGHMETARLLLELGVDIEARNESGETPLLSAVADGQSEAVRFLLERGACTEVMDNHGFTPLTLAANLDSNPETLRLLFAHGAEVPSSQRWVGTIWNCAARNEQPSILRELIERKLPLPAPEDGGDVLLHEALSSPLHLELLLNYGVKVADAADVQRHGKPLHAAASQGLRESAELLLRHGAPINECDASGKTPLQYALEDWQQDMAQWLRERGAE